MKMDQNMDFQSWQNRPSEESQRINEYMNGTVYRAIPYPDNYINMQNHILAAAGIAGGREIAQSYWRTGGWDNDSNSYNDSEGSDGPFVFRIGPVVIMQPASDADDKQDLHKKLKEWINQQVARNLANNDLFKSLNNMPSCDASDKKPDCIAPELLTKRLRDW